MQTQVEQEMDMILEKKDVMQSALKVWNEKVIPAVLEYGDQSTGKASTLYIQTQSDFEGTNCIWPTNTVLSLEP